MTDIENWNAENPTAAPIIPKNKQQSGTLSFPAFYWQPMDPKSKQGKSPMGKAKIIPIAVCSIPPGPPVTLQGGERVPLYSRVSRDHAGIIINATRTEVSKGKWDNIRPQGLPVLLERRAIQFQAWENALPSFSNKFVRIFDVKCAKNGMFTCGNVDATIYETLNNLPIELRYLTAFPPNAQLVPSPLSLLPFSDKYAREGYDNVPPTPSTMLILNRDYTQKDMKPVLQLPKIIYNNEMIDACQSYVNIQKISPTFFEDEKFNDKKAKTAPMEAQVKFTLHIMQRDHPLQKGDRPERLVIRDMGIYSEHSDTYPAIHPLVPDIFLLK